MIIQFTGEKLWAYSECHLQLFFVYFTMIVAKCTIFPLRSKCKINVVYFNRVDILTFTDV